MLCGISYVYLFKGSFASILCEEICFIVVSNYLIKCAFVKFKKIVGNLKLHKKKSESEIDEHRGSGSMP